MPCRDERPIYDGLSPTERKAREALDRATRAACNLATGIEELYGRFVLDSRNELESLRREGYITSETLTWVITHREADEQRKKALINSAKSKLTVDELEALGLK